MGGPSEIISKKPYGAAADQWSLGCILYTFLVGSPPFESAEIKDTFEKVSRAQYELPVWLSTDAQDLVAKLIVHNPDARLSTRQILAHPFLQGPIAKAPSSLFLTASAASQPLSTQHLKAIRQQTRHGLIELLANGHVWIDFRVDAVITCISADGGRITLYPKGCRPEDTGRLRPLQSYTYPHLPVATLKIYEYARRFVALLRSKTPRVIISTERFKAFLMDNGPPSDFLIRYNDHEIRAEYSIGNEVLRIFRSDKQIAEVVRPSASALDEARLDARCRLVLSDFLGRYRQASETASRISPDQDLQLAPFPFIVREHPSSNAETGQTGLCHPTLQTLPLTTLSEGLPKHSRQAQPDISNASCNFAFVYKTYLPDVGWCLASTSDEFLLLFSDGVTVLVDGRTNMVGFHDLKAGSTRWFKIDQALPHFAKKKLAYFPRFVQLLKQGYGHSFVT